MLGNDAMEFLKKLHHLDEIWKHHDDAEYNDRQLTQFAERYHEHKLKLLGIADVSVSLLERAASLVGNPGTNISGSTDMACEQWQKDYERWRNERVFACRQVGQSKH